MFELIADKLPELQRLEDRIAGLERDHGNTQARVQGLAVRANEAREDDLNREAAALNLGRKVPPRREPELRGQLEDAERELEVLGRRLDLARADRSRFIAEHSEHLARLLAEAQATEGAKVAEGAAKVLDDLLTLYKAEDDARALSRLAPAPAEENTGAPERVTAVFGPVHHATVAGPRRGEIESTLRYLQTLGPATEIGEADAGAA